ncbi:flagellar hook-length control protein FliK [Pseudohongiella sp. SYSU M77423]|uniref:flagellar hook-length control protein FliK n=1 Tax=Pseudohongiella sp. SYSU M77423 TaxID=3042312 RepID=UPI00248085FB|nr:flagellar hook-length control protein FliK [Pseudohongiella sp. SYSU M77423]MDH7942978.1 flagellar hook-length control protein FliK [Pseudohongiella sp. SYSU M77423]
MLSANEFMQFLSGAIMPATKPAIDRSHAVVPVEGSASSLLSGEHSSEDARARISEMLSRLDSANPEKPGEDSEFARTFLHDLQSLLASEVSNADWFAQNGSALSTVSQQPVGSLLMTGEPGTQAQPWTLDELSQLAQQFLVDGKQLPEAAWQDGQNLPQQLAALLAGLEPSGSARSMSAALGIPAQSSPATATSATDVLSSAGVATTAQTSAPVPGLKLSLDAVQPRGEQTVSADVSNATADKAARISETISSQAALASATSEAAAAAAAAQTNEAAASLADDNAGATLAANQAVNLQNSQPQPAAPDLSAVQPGASTPGGAAVNAKLQTVGTEASNQLAANTTVASQSVGSEPLTADDGLSTPQLSTNTEKSAAAAAATAVTASVDAAIPAAPPAESRRSTLAEQLSSANRRGADAGTTTLGSATAGPLQAAAGFTVSEPMAPAGGNLSLAIEQVMAESAGTDSNSPARQEASLLKSATPTAQELAAELFGAADQRRANSQSAATLSNAASMAPAARGADSSLMLQVGSFGQAGWGDNVARQLMVMTANGINSAQIRLDPPELGTLTVRVQMVDQSATVNFVSQHAMVRDALDAQIPRLQDLFRNEGIDLLDVTVSDQQTSAQGDGHGQDGRGSRHSGGELDSDRDSAEALANIPARSLHLVDEHV